MILSSSHLFTSILIIVILPAFPSPTSSTFLSSDSREGFELDKSCHRFVSQQQNPAWAGHRTHKNMFSLQYDQYRDIESQEELLVPGMSKTDNMLRWGFIRKVYGIVSLQLILTAIVAGIIYAVPPVRGFVTSSLAFQLTFAILPLVGKILPLSRQFDALSIAAHSQ